jgi:DNA modification methylase
MHVNVEILPLDRITPNPHNSRLHSAGQIADLVKSIREFGWTNPLLVDEDGLLLAGHGRLMAAKKAGLSEVPCVRKVGLSPAQKRAYVIADNQLGLGSEWDEKVLKMELQELMSMDFDMGLLGFDGEQLNDILAATYEESAEGDSAGWTEEDEVAPAPAVPVTRRGDVWLMDKHRLMCGDSTSMDDMAKLAAGKVDLWLTDPPYNVAYEGGTSDKLTIKNDDMPDAEFRTFLAAAYAAADSVMRPGAAFYVWHADSEGFNFRAAARDVKWPVKQCLIWRKNGMVLGRQDYQWQHEPCLYGWKPGAAHQWHGGRKQTTVRDLEGHGLPLLQLDGDRWQLSVGGKTYVLSGEAAVQEVAPSIINEAKPKTNDAHPTMKPVALFERQLLNSSKPGEVVADSFGGSGTTLICCEKHHRQARIMELDERYADVIVRRWQEFTGRQAVLEGTADSFDDVRAARAVDQVAA